jgi:hypothetical protein
VCFVLLRDRYPADAALAQGRRGSARRHGGSQRQGERTPSASDRGMQESCCGRGSLPSTTVI